MMLYLYLQSGYHDEHDKHSMDHLIEFMRAGRVKVTQRRKWESVSPIVANKSFKKPIIPLIITSNI